MRMHTRAHTNTPRTHTYAGRPAHMVYKSMRLERPHTHAQRLINAKLYSAHSAVMEQDGELTVLPLHSLNDK